ncbi:hypothetical protein INT46_011898 [Mucor plumbeus]|uniref:DUF3020 domain-containing protein n=1 Tax=Mucor plumbeus TaxID=97098 RepID=A0A8H7RQP2_9FUNG|nr:hypothetical protein INT46_011898 [Mucor plumbeus]
MENPNIHNIPYERSRDQKRWKGHAKKVSSRAETTERMRKWRAENRDKNKRNDLRCRVYRLARQKFGESDSVEKQQFINEEINRRLGRRMFLEQKNKEHTASTDDTSSLKVKNEFFNSRSPSISPPQPETLNELPFYCAPLHKIELPSINMTNRRPSQSTEPSGYINKSQPPSPMSDNAWHEDDTTRRLSGCSMNSSTSSRSINTNNNNITTNNITNTKPDISTLDDSNNDKNTCASITTTTTTTTATTTTTKSLKSYDNIALPPMQTFLPPVSQLNQNQLHANYYSSPSQ